MEVKRSGTFRERDLATLQLFQEDYPMARCFLLYGGRQEYQMRRIRVMPLEKALPRLKELLG